MIFSLFQYIFPCFAKIFIPPYFQKFPPCFRKIYLLFTYFMCISFPPPTLTMMHLCITQYTYWTPLGQVIPYEGWMMMIPAASAKRVFPDGTQRPFRSNRMLTVRDYKTNSL